MKAALAQHGVEVIAISKDTVEEARRHRSRDGLSFTLLSDPKLENIRRFGVEHQRAIEFSTGTFTIAGVPLALVPKFQTMAIPTSILVDEHGDVRWTDQSEDYRLRSNEDRVLEAVGSAFGTSEPTREPAPG